MISKDNNIPTLNGLVLAGGKSKRMGHDKTIITWHGKEQRYYAADLLGELCNEVYISCRPDQQSDIDSNYNTLPDIQDSIGPLAGIISAFEKDSTCAWLVIASDLPLLDKNILEYLIAHRDPNKIATTFKSPHDGLPEPLITIWEPTSKEALSTFIAEGITCPRKVLIRSEDKVKIIEPPAPEKLINTNTPEDAAKVEALLKH